MADHMNSKAAEGKVCPFKDEKRRRSWTATSAFVAEDQARKLAIDVPRLRGTHIAVLEVPDDAPIVVEEDEDGSGHCDLHGDPDLLFSYIVGIVAVHLEGNSPKKNDSPDRVG